MKKTTPPSKAMLELAKSLSFNAQNYIPKGGVSFSLFKVGRSISLGYSIKF